MAEALRVDAPELFSTKEYPSESVSQLHENMMCQFDKFLRAAVKKIEGKE
jgi:hypothetical protein